MTAWGIIKIDETVRAAARKALQDREIKITRSDRKDLENIANGKRKQINAPWWDWVHEKLNQSRLGKLARMADPESNPNEHERANAAAKLKAFKPLRPPGMPLEPVRRPMPDFLDPNQSRRAAYGKTKPREASRADAKPKQDGVKQADTKPKASGVKQQAASHAGVKQKPKDRNADRHKPGYMREYMREYQRRRRAKAKQGRK